MKGLRYWGQEYHKKIINVWECGVNESKIKTYSLKANNKVSEAERQEKLSLDERNDPFVMLIRTWTLWKALPKGAELYHLCPVWIK